MAKHKILYISYDGMTDPLGQSQVLPYLTGLSKKGYRFHLISFEKAENYTLANRELIANLCQQAHIQWHPLPYTKKPPVLSTLRDVWRMQKTARQLQQQEQFAATHCRSYIAAFAGIHLKRKYQVPFVFDIRGFWPDERIDGKIWSLQNPVFRLVYRFFKRKEKGFFASADYTVSLTHAAEKIIHSWTYLKQQPIPLRVIPCCADFEHFKTSQKQEDLSAALRKKLDIAASDFVLSYLGSIGTWYMLDEMLDFFKVLQKTKPQAKFLFITGEAPEGILQKAKEKGIPAASLRIQKASRMEVPAYIALSAASIFFIKPLYSKQASSPTKMAEIMGMGIPVIANTQVGDVETILQDSQAGVLIPAFSNHQYQKAVQELVQLLQTKQPEHIRKLAVKHFALNDGIDRYASVYASVCL